MIDPTRITRYDYSYEGLEELWIFCVCVAGKHALRTARAVDALLNDSRFLGVDELRLSPLQKINVLIQRGTFIEAMKSQGLGQYNRVMRVLEETIRIGIDLKKASVDELQSLPGVGPKTSRFFVLHTRQGVRHAVLDTHILKFLRDEGLDVPSGVPSGKRYMALEQEFLRMADEKGRDPAEFDLEIWREYSGHRTL